MLFSAMTGFTAAYYSGDLWIGIAAAAATGAVMGLLMGLLAVTLGTRKDVSRGSASPCSAPASPSISTA